MFPHHNFTSRTNYQSIYLSSDLHEFLGRRISIVTRMTHRLAVYLAFQITALTAFSPSRHSGKKTGPSVRHDVELTNFRSEGYFPLSLIQFL
ncbi:hypothetical protein PILCRDRAFT_827375 [Piloderma croceum F 1598]|uniref:Uncharacterized protein n=1 Tax=Piloderma croceum (strain F 1598) TaxID=765440 RepID=A0A0C3F5I5_PILCF|nr:hypothetical protein PILCRDRAFT_827375 [Piloderma croceum F 1598]